jgi:hypothetical protein
MREVRSYLPRKINLLRRTVLMKSRLAEQY